MEKAQRIHFVSIAGMAMQDLAIGLSVAGHQVTCSDKELPEITKAKLLKYNILPDKTGWFPERIHQGLDVVIVGTHTTTDNPELQKAQELKLKISSFPDFIYEHSINKQRMVVVGTHGKTIIASLIIHVLNHHHRDFDYVVGTTLNGLEHSVRLSDAPLIVIEGQDLPASPLDSTPVFLKYHHHIGVISGIEFGKSHGYPSEDEYIRQFDLFEGATPKGGVLVFFELDPIVTALSNMDRPDVLFVPYKTHASTHEGGQEFLVTANKERIPLKLTGKHNLQNLSAAKEALKKVGITGEMFYQAIRDFSVPAN